jgi:hypothetical protein
MCGICFPLLYSMFPVSLDESSCDKIRGSSGSKVIGVFFYETRNLITLFTTVTSLPSAQQKPHYHVRQQTTLKPDECRQHRIILLTYMHFNIIICAIFSQIFSCKIEGFRCGLRELCLLGYYAA